MISDLNRQFISTYSEILDRRMNMLVYGDAGVPVIAFPCQDGMCDNWEGFQMPEELYDYILSEQIQLFCVDTVDTESWSDKNGDKEHRAWMQECYYRYIIEEAMPKIREINGGEKLPIAAGYSLGAVHAAIVFFRRPELFSGVLACSGCYTAPHFWDGWCNGTLYDNSPLDFLRNMPADHSYIDIYNSKQIVICVGQGRWEGACLTTTKEMKQVFEEKGINGWVDLWGFDVDHDWPWWKMQTQYHLPMMLREI